MDVSKWLEELELSQYAKAFAENEIDTDTLKHLTADDLKELGVSALGHRKKLLAAIADLRNQGEKPQPSTLEGTGQASDGERRQVTVLFADVAEFTLLSRGLDPEDTHTVLNRYFEAVDSVVQSYGGSIDKHIGDSVMAVFGAPVAHSNDPERAVRAALDIHRVVAGIEPPLRVHAGVASGQVVASGIGSDAYQEYTVTGDSVNLASRLQDLANPGETLISDATYRAITLPMKCEAVEDVSIKGLPKSIRIWRVSSLLSDQFVGSSRPIVGRRTELHQLAGAIEQCKETGKGQAIYVRGEAGIGKTRLIDEVAAIAERQGFAIHIGHALDFGARKGRDAIRAIVRSLLGIPMRSGKTIRTDGTKRALSDGIVSDDQVAHLNDLLDLPQPVELRALFDAMDNSGRNQGQRETVVELVQQISRRRPLVLLSEDIHWADANLLAHLASLAVAVGDCPALLIMTSRAEGDPLDQAWRAMSLGSSLTTMDLGPLRREEALELAREYTDPTNHYALACIERAQGNPLYLEQLLRGAEETIEGAVPGSIQSVVQARMDGLDAPDKRAFQAASVLGQRFSVEALRYLIDSPHYTCAGLIERHMLRPHDADFAFAHALVREGAYASLLKAKRRDLHLRAAQWFEVRDLVFHAEHLDQAEDPGAARAYLNAACEHTSLYRYERALQLVDKGLESTADRGIKYELSCLRGDILRNLGSINESVEAFQQALNLSDDELQKSTAWIGLAASMRILDRYDDALEVLDRAEIIASRENRAADLTKICHLRGNLYFPLGEIDGCLEQHELARKHARAASVLEDEAHALGGLGDAYYMRGRMITAFDHFNRCVELCRQQGFGRIEVANLPMRGHSRLYKNDLNGALEDGIAAADMASKVSHHRAEIIARNVILDTYECMADWKGLEEQARVTLHLARRLGARRFEPQCLDQIAQVLALQGRSAEALGLVEEAVSICRETGVTFIGPWILGTLSMLSADATTRRKAMEEAEDILHAGAVSHSYLWFYRKAIEVCLAHGDWNGVERYAAALEDYTQPEPLPWSDFFVARGRALAAYGRGSRDDATMQELQRLCEKASGIGLNSALPALAQALRQE